MVGNGVPGVPSPYSHIPPDGGTHTQRRLEVLRATVDPGSCAMVCQAVIIVKNYVIYALARRSKRGRRTSAVITNTPPPTNRTPICHHSVVTAAVIGIRAHVCSTPRTPWAHSTTRLLSHLGLGQRRCIDVGPGLLCLLSVFHSSSRRLMWGPTPSISFSRPGTVPVVPLLDRAKGSVEILFSSHEYH